MIVVILLILWCYFMVLFYLITTKFITKEKHAPLLQEFPSVTLLIAVRNEVENLPQLLSCIAQLEYNEESLEVLIIDDHSTDGSIDLLNTTSQQNVKTIQLKTHTGKKRAIELGVQKARGEIILTTDADCQFGPWWVKSMVSELLNKRLVMVLGGIRLIDNHKLFTKLQETELSVLMGITKFSADKKNPLLSNGANCAFYKNKFLELNPYSKNYEIASGDDIFFLHQLKKLHAKVGFNSQKESIVHTRPVEAFSQFIQQRVRWAAKSKYYKDIHSIIFGFIVFSTNMVLLFSFIVALIDLLPFIWVFYLFILKWMIDLFFILVIPQYLKPKSIVLYSPLLTLSYPIYTLVIAFLSLLYKPTWKGRKI